MPVKSLDEKDLATARDAAVQVFSDWESRLKDGETVLPAPAQPPAAFRGQRPLQTQAPEPGLYLVFESCGHDPCTIHVMGKPRNLVWQRDFHAAHTPTTPSHSVGISTPGDSTANGLTNGQRTPARERRRIYRMKGVLSVKGSNKALVFQGVHMLFDAKFDREWTKDESRQTPSCSSAKISIAAGLTEAFKPAWRNRCRDSSPNFEAGCSS